jgi:hypothetical protein
VAVVSSLPQFFVLRVGDDAWGRVTGEGKKRGKKKGREVKNN